MYFDVAFNSAQDYVRLL